MGFDRTQHPRFALGYTATVAVGSVALVVGEAPLWVAALGWIAATAVFDCTSPSPKVRYFLPGDRLRLRRTSSRPTGTKQPGPRRPSAGRPPR